MESFSWLKFGLFCSVFLFVFFFPATNASWEEAVRKSVSYKTEPLEGKAKVTEKRIGKNLKKTPNSWWKIFSNT